MMTLTICREGQHWFDRDLAPIRVHVAGRLHILELRACGVCGAVEQRRTGGEWTAEDLLTGLRRQALEVAA